MLNIKEASRKMSITLAGAFASVLAFMADGIVGTNSIVFIYSGDAPSELLQNKE